MPFADDLLELARDLTGLYAGNPRQATLRRAISTAYYALFHLLVSDAALNWAYPEFRPTLGRLFDHGPMRSASDSQISQLGKYFKGKPPASPERTISEHLLKVANTFVDAQGLRLDADYNTAREWAPAYVEDQIKAVAEAFQSWSLIRETPAAQAYLLLLLGTRGQRSPNPTSR